MENDEQLKIKVAGLIEEIGMCEITAKQVDWALANNYNIMRVVMLMDSERYCAFLSPTRLARSIISVLREMNDGVVTVDVVAIITKAFANTNFAVMKLEMVNDTTHVSLRPGTPINKSSTTTVH